MIRQTNAGASPLVGLSNAGQMKPQLNLILFGAGKTSSSALINGGGD